MWPALVSSYSRTGHIAALAVLLFSGELRLYSFGDPTAREPYNRHVAAWLGKAFPYLDAVGALCYSSVGNLLLACTTAWLSTGEIQDGSDNLKLSSHVLAWRVVSEGSTDSLEEVPLRRDEPNKIQGVIVAAALSPDQTKWV